MSHAEPGHLTNCPHCGWPVAAADRCCEDCGKLLRAVNPGSVPTGEAGETASSRPQTQAAPGRASRSGEPAALADGSSGPASAPEAGGLPARSDPPYRPADSALDATPFPAISLGSECPLLTLEVDRGRCLVEGMDCVLRLRLSAAAANVSALRVRISSSFGVGRPWSFEMPGCQLGAGRSRVVRFECAPPQGVRGLKVLQWDVSFTCAEQEQRFEAQSEHSVYASDLSAESLVGKLSIDIHQGDAGVVRLGDFYSDALKSRSITLRELVQEMTEAPPVWEALDLWQKEARSMVLPPPPPEARLRALTLHLETGRIHLLAAQPLRLGRGRECDLVARCFDRSGRALEQESLRISKIHACLERCAEGVRYTDRSGNGTLLDGLPLVRGTVLLSSAGEHPAALGGTSAAAAPLTLHIRPLACGVQDRPDDCAFGEACGFHHAAGAVVRRSDEVAEVFVAVWCHVRLRQADPDLGGLRVWRRQDAFGFRLGKQSGWLAPGLTLDLGSGHRLCVSTLAQQHLEEGRQHDNA